MYFQTKKTFTSVKGTGNDLKVPLSQNRDVRISVIDRFPAPYRTFCSNKRKSAKIDYKLTHPIKFHTHTVSPLSNKELKMHQKNEEIKIKLLQLYIDVVISLRNEIIIKI